MYKGIGPPFRDLEKNNEWCEYDLNQINKFRYQNYIFFTTYSILILVMGIFLLVGVLFYEEFNLEIFILISFGCVFIIIIFYLIHRFWKKKKNEVTEYKDNFCICFTRNNVEIKKLINSIRVYLFHCNIPYEIIKGNGSVREVYRRNFKRTDTNEDVVELFTENKKVLNIRINTQNFDDKSQAVKLKNIIWDENSKSTEELSF